MGLPIPLLFLADVAGQEGRAEIVDGSQRVRTLARFMQNDLRLSGLKRLTQLCSSKVRGIVLDNLRAMGTKNSLLILTSIATDIVSKTFQKDEIVSGNVDAREIRKLAKGYGFNHPKAPQIQQHANRIGYSMMAPTSGSLVGDALLTVKTHRNKLAHGSTSFADVGRDFTHDDIVRIKCEVIAYLDAVLQNVSEYLSDQRYRR